VSIPVFDLMWPGDHPAAGRCPAPARAEMGPDYLVLLPGTARAQRPDVRACATLGKRYGLCMVAWATVAGPFYQKFRFRATAFCAGTA